MFIILFLKLLSKWTYPLFSFSKLSTFFFTGLVDSFILYPEYLLNSALFSVFCEVILLGISPDLLSTCCSVSGMIFVWLYIGMVSCIILSSKSVEWLSGSCLCLYEKSYSLLLLYITLLEELELIILTCYTVIRVTVYYCYTLYFSKTYMWTSIYTQPCVNS